MAENLNIYKMAVNLIHTFQFNISTILNRPVRYYIFHNNEFLLPLMKSRLFPNFKQFWILEILSIIILNLNRTEAELKDAALIWLVSLKIVFNVSIFKPAFNLTRFLTDLRRGSDSLNADSVIVIFIDSH